MEKIKFSHSDKLIVLGDIIDKGAHSLRLAKALFSAPNVYCILGNHEYDFLRYYRVLMKEATTDFDAVLQRLKTWFPCEGSLLDWDILDAFDSLPAYLETDDYICVHAGVYLDERKNIMPLKSTPVSNLVYNRVFKDTTTRVVSEKCVLYGHTPTNYIHGGYQIIKYPRKIQQFEGRNIKDYSRVHLDTGCYITGVLGCFCLEKCKSFYFKK